MKADRFIKKMRGLDALILSGRENILYASGFTGDSAAVVLTRGRKVIVSDFRYATQIAEQAPGFEFADVSGGSITDRLAALLNEMGVKTVGYEEDVVTAKDYFALKGSTGAELVPSSNIMYGVREIKTKSEIACIRRAAKIADMVFEKVLGAIKPGVYETEIMAEIEYLSRRLGSEDPAFRAIVASGENGAKPHAEAARRRVKRGDLVTLDFGCRVHGYCSDMTRTVAVGDIDSEREKIYHTVLRAQELALEALRAGAICAEVDSAARDYIKSAGYGEYFGHGLGHCVGLAVHERPMLSQRFPDTKIKAGMVTSVEPGIYIPGLGGVRIEDLCAVTEDGYENLTSSPKELIVL